MISSISYQPNEEVQEGLIQTLLRIASPEHETLPLCVITTSPNRWMRCNTLGKAKLFDISMIVGDTTWKTEADLLDSLMNRLRIAGWPEMLIRTEYESPTSRRKADVALLDTKFSPIAEFVIKTNKYNKSSLTHHLTLLSLDHSSQNVFVFDGRTLSKFDLNEDTLHDVSEFPSPTDLGLRPFIVDDTTESASANIDLIYPSSESNLIENLNKYNFSSIIIDHTLPWGRFLNHNLFQTNDLLPVNLKNNRLDSVATLISIISDIKITKKIIAITPRAIQDLPVYLGLRMHLRSGIGLTGIVELPEGLFSPFTGIPSAILVLGGDQPGARIAFSSVTSESSILQPEKQQWLIEFLKGINGQPMAIGFLADVNDEVTWSANAFSPEIKSIENRLKEIGEVCTLGELCDIYLGSHYSREELPTGQGLKIVRGRDLSMPSLTKENLASFSEIPNLPQRNIVKVGDILLQRIGTNPKSIIVSANLEGVVASDTVFVLRPKTENVDSILLVQFLNSNVGKELLNSRIRSSVGAPTLSSSGVRSIPVPRLTIEISYNLNELQVLENKLRNQAESLASMRLELFSAASREDLETRLGEIKQTANIIDKSLAQVDSLQYRIQNFYPFPLAYSYRTLGSYTNPVEQYNEQLRLAENILALLGSITLALLNNEQRKKLGLDLKRMWESGVSPGHWKQIAQNGAKILADSNDNHLALSLNKLWTNKKKEIFLNNINQLIEAKNSFKHDRVSKSEEYCREYIRSLQPVIDEIVQNLGFLMEYPITLVRDIDIVRGSHIVKLIVLRYVGDHPGLPQEEISNSEPLTRGDLYIQIRRDLFLPLFPFITCWTCPRCETREIYFIDSCDTKPNGKAKLKSFERGHTEENSEIAGELIKII